ncbi:hypothetical protein NLJ89_g4816 [Agrocybe chaxingu]|uniref:Uncharacterized protein n=1 Tax=Agrocybe chaxingu TaxID=84603 RepID=A0A9W8K2H6_9AGAR|nr:hypothetical protein NLJ89_g4816 [Agrocybe chaxingu]
MLPTQVSVYSLKDIVIETHQLKCHSRLSGRIQGKPLRIAKTQDLRPTVSFAYAVAEPEPVDELDLDATSILSSILEEKGRFRRMLDTARERLGSLFCCLPRSSRSRSS